MRGHSRLTIREDTVSGVAQVLEHLRVTLAAFFPEYVHSSQSETALLVEEAYRLADMQYGIEQAATWADGFQISEDMIVEDVRRFEAAGNCLITMAETARRLRNRFRLSADRVDSVVSSQNPDRDQLRAFGDKGVPLLVTKEFKANGIGQRPSLRRRYRLVEGAVDKMIFEGLWKQGLVLILPPPLVARARQQIYFSPLSWAPKQGKMKGRNVMDMGRRGHQHQNSPSVLNGKEVKTLIDNAWGVIEHPTLHEIVQMIWDFYEETCYRKPDTAWEQLVLWKMDLKGAFTLLDFDAASAPLLAGEMSGNLVAIFLCGVFGWTGMPSAFQVVNRAIRWELKQAGTLTGRMTMYTDDCIGICLEENLANELDTVRGLCHGLLGPEAVEESKTEWGRRLTVIGWDIDLNLRLVTVARRNALKAFYGFMTVDLDTKVPLSTVQRWASWAERYGEICTYMKPYRRLLYGATRRLQCATTILLDQEVKRAVRLYGALIALVLVVEQRFNRTMESFQAREPDLIIEFDASLGGVGVIWYAAKGTKGGRPSYEVPLGGCAVDLGTLEFGKDASFQNCAEFIGIVVGLVGARAIGVKVNAVILRGDSRSALTWARGGNFRSLNVMNAATVYASLCATTGFRVIETSLITSESNWRCDWLSRKGQGESWKTIIRRISVRDPTLTDLREVTMEVQEVLDLCDPRKGWSTDEEFSCLWRRSVAIGGCFS